MIKPLTLEELKQKYIKPVYVVSIPDRRTDSRFKHSRIFGEWGIFVPSREHYVIPCNTNMEEAMTINAPYSFYEKSFVCFDFEPTQEQLLEYFPVS
jgi:hypothetical protein